ncbi:20367_t:CDS:2 [Gigaspora rosea]|nr:20367_t:CDS:2 [Gigaspora rosea]
MNPNPNKRPTAKYVNFQVGLWNEEMLSSDDDNEIKRLFSEIDNTPPVIDTIKTLPPMSKSINSFDISEYSIIKYRDCLKLGVRVFNVR